MDDTRRLEIMERELTITVARYRFMQQVLEHLTGQPLFGPNDDERDLDDPASVAQDIRDKHVKPVFTAMDRTRLIDALQVYRRFVTDEVDRTSEFDLHYPYNDFGEMVKAVSELISKIARMDVV